MSDKAKKRADKGLHIERESAGYVQGRTRRQREGRISLIWRYIKSNREHFRAPSHHPVSSPKLVKSTGLKRRRSELHVDEKHERHIHYADTLCLAFRRASIQFRVEVKQRQRKGELKRSFAEVTIKIGDKATQRVEESINVNLDRWEKDGFYKALKKGIDLEVYRTREKKGKAAAKEKREKYQTLIKILEAELQKKSGVSLKDAQPYLLVNLQRDTYETEYSPGCDVKTVLEVKTDDCDWETVFSASKGHRGSFAQIEIEHIKGRRSQYQAEAEALIMHEDFGIVATSDSKEDRAMRQMEIALLPQNDTQKDIDRVIKNRNFIADALGYKVEFHVLNAKKLGVKLKPG